jgi:anti-sigma regulatory factor (Ser/Thr protein kinase)
MAPDQMSAVAPTVRLELTSRPQTLTLVRGMLAGVAELLALDPELLDDVKTAVSEACNNVVVHAYPDEPGPLDVLLYISREGVEVLVRDRGAGIPPGALVDERAEGIGLAVMRALAQELDLRPGPDGGTEVRMQFSAEREGKLLFEAPAPAAADDGFDQHLQGEAVASLSPVELVGAVLGRLARALAANARFSLDRFSDIYLVTDAIAAHAAAAAAGERIYFALQSDDRRLDLTVGPFRGGSGSNLAKDAETRAFPLALLTDELAIEPAGEHELLRAALVDARAKN